MTCGAGLSPYHIDFYELGTHFWTAQGQTSAPLAWHGTLSMRFGGPGLGRC
jgi:hypothetical protein